MGKKRILVVDDEEGFTNVLQLNLEATGDYEVQVENDAERAIETALRFQPHLILLDIIMPNLEGPDVANQIKENDTLKNTPIVFLTATVKEDEIDQKRGKIGGHPFIAKPSNLSVLLQSIERNLIPSF